MMIVQQNVANPRVYHIGTEHTNHRVQVDDEDDRLVFSCTCGMYHTYIQDFGPRTPHYVPCVHIRVVMNIKMEGGEKRPMGMNLVEE